MIEDIHVYAPTEIFFLPNINRRFLHNQYYYYSKRTATHY